jgi:hypothetical protein
MLLIIFLGLIAKLTSVFSECDIGTQDVKYFDWYKVCFSVLTRLLKQAAFKTAALLFTELFMKETALKISASV